MELTIRIKPNSKEPWGEIALGSAEVPLPYSVADEIIKIAMDYVAAQARRPPKGSLLEAERAAVRHALHVSDSYQGAADQLGCTPRTLFNMRKRHGLE